MLPVCPISLSKRKGRDVSRPLLVLIGPTAVGKTSLSLEIALEFGGEIVSADSRLLYRGLDIGTAKPTPDERNIVPHHLIDVCEPGKSLSLAEYQHLAYKAIAEIHCREHLPILVGGTGQYVMAVVEGWGIPKVAPQRRLRKALAALGGEELARWLRVLDPDAAQRIDARNVRRVIRALEVCLTAGRPISELQRKTPPPYTSRILGLTCDREALYQRIDRRVDRMMEKGLLEEVQGLLDTGCKKGDPAMSGLGYRQLVGYLTGELSMPEAVERIKFETHRFVRQQYTWFRPDDPRISWFDVDSPRWKERLAQAIDDWLSGM